MNQAVVRGWFIFIFVFKEL